MTKMTKLHDFQEAVVKKQLYSHYHVLVCFGGASSEHWVSCRSAYTIIKALRNLGHKVSRLGITKNSAFLPLTEGCADELILADDWEKQVIEVNKKFNVGELSDAVKMTIGDEICENNLRKIFFASLPAYFADVDLIFPALHGKQGEDGVIQGFFELLQIPYVGCRLGTSFLGMNKIYSKLLWQSKGLPVLPFVSWDKDVYDEAEVQGTEQFAIYLKEKFMEAVNYLHLPFFVKPVAGGSSIGANKVESMDDFQKALAEGFLHDTQLLAEPFVRSKEYELGVFDFRDKNIGRELILSAICEISKNNDSSLYTFDAKYCGNLSSQVTIPAKLKDETAAKLQNYAKEAFLALGGSHLSRVDFFVDDSEENIYISEINTLPGFTPSSLYALAYENLGISKETIIQKLLEMTLKK